MGKTIGFIEYERREGATECPEKRVYHFNEFHKSLSLKDQRSQGARCMSCGVPFCQAGAQIAGATTGCPLHNLIPETNELVSLGNMEQAYHRLSKTHGLPEFTSRVCPALCESACTCGYQGDSVSVRENEKAIIEYAFRNGLIEEKTPEVRSGKSVAIIGSGPAGLAAAQLLNRRGHQVTIFEKEAMAGGLLRYGIPNMKLDKRIIDRRIKVMEDAGIVFRCGVNVGVNVTADEILSQYDRVILCTGAARPRDLKVTGRENAKGVVLAIDFLKQVNEKLMEASYDSEELKERKEFRGVKGKHVIVVGGGDTATDCVATALRLGAASVKQLIRRPAPAAVRTADNPWPEQAKIQTTDYGQEEAIAVYGEDPRSYQRAISEILVDKRNHVKAVMVAETKPQKNPANGRETWVPVEGTEQRVKADLILIAAGFAGADSALCEAFAVEQDAKTNVKASEKTFATSRDRVFAAGDVRRGQSLVVWAIAEGRQVARTVDESLMGYSNL